MNDLITIALDELGKNFDLLKHKEKQSLDEVIETQILVRTLLQNEALRLSEKLGPKHIRVIKIGEQLKINRSLISALNVEKEINAIAVPDISEKSALVHGRVVDESDRGISQLMVCLIDSQSNPVSNELESVTDKSGYFSIVLNEKKLEWLAKKYPNGFYLGVMASSGKVLHRERKTLQIESSNRTQIEIVLNRQRLTTISKSTKVVKGVASNKKPEGKDGRILVPNLVGIKLASAKSKVKKHDLKIGNIKFKKSKRMGIVISQSPKEGALSVLGSSVNLEVGDNTVKP